MWDSGIKRSCIELRKAAPVVRPFAWCLSVERSWFCGAMAASWVFQLRSIRTEASSLWREP